MELPKMPTAGFEPAHLAVQDPKSRTMAGADGRERVAPRESRAPSDTVGRARATDSTTLALMAFAMLAFARRRRVRA